MHSACLMPIANVIIPETGKTMQTRQNEYQIVPLSAYIDNLMIAFIFE